ncbi:MAG: formyltransferase family protein [Patescibacteria group bacterium]
MNIVYYGGRQSGVVGLLTLMALGHKVVCVVPVDDPVESVALAHGLNVQKPKNVNLDEFVDYLDGLGADLFVCCHGRQIIKARLLNRYKAINVHPCLYKYKGADPISRVLADGEKRISVAVHWMTEFVDRGETIVELFKERENDTVIGVYKELYPLYSRSLVEALKIIERT